MAKLTSEMRHAFHCLGVSPDADLNAIRSAWKKIVRHYHPDQFKNDKAEGNRRLAELNAAFDLVSDWTEEGVGYASYQAAQSRKAAAKHKATAERASAQRKKQADQKTEALKQQRLEEAAARKRAAELNRQEALKRAAAESASESVWPNTRAKDSFLAALSHLATQPKNQFSLSL
ncbi:MAG: J domain-containing protein [Tateyamaria sp.]|uniref:J domain-containing protein n=1 Tax=Tateyamaria sp. TaxID=1929288 RepID=UPI003277124B